MRARQGRDGGGASARDHAGGDDDGRVTNRRRPGAARHGCIVPCCARSPAPGRGTRPESSFAVDVKACPESAVDTGAGGGVRSAQDAWSAVPPVGRDALLSLLSPPRRRDPCTTDAAARTGAAWLFRTDEMKSGSCVVIVGS